MCYKCLAYESKMAYIFYLIVGISVGCPLFPYSKVQDFPLSCRLYPYMEVVGSLIYMAKFPWAANSTVH